MVQPSESAGDDEQNIGGIQLDKLLVRVLAPALRRDGRHGAFQDFQQRLLHALTGHVAGNGWVLGLAGNLVHLVDVDDAALCALHVKVRGLQQLQQDIFHVFAHIAGLGEAGGIGDGKGDIEKPGQGLRQVGLTGTGGAQHQDIGLRDLHLIALGLLAAGLQRSRFFGLDALVMVIDRHRQHTLGLVLADHVLIEEGGNLRGSRQAHLRIGGFLRLLLAQFLFDDLIA